MCLCSSDMMPSDKLKKIMTIKKRTNRILNVVLSPHWLLTLFPDISPPPPICNPLAFMLFLSRERASSSHKMTDWDGGRMASLQWDCNDR